MCRFCAEHGAGKKWYLNVKNYVDDLVKNDTERREFLENAVGPMEKTSAFRYMELLAPYQTSEWFVRHKELRESFLYWHQGQILPLEDTREVMKIASPIAKVECLCRRTLRGDTGGEKYCLMFGVMLDYLRDWPDYARGGIETLTVDEAIAEVEKSEKEGLIHSVWTYKTPYIGALCQCAGSSTCLAIKHALNFGFMLHKGEYVAIVDTDMCIDCDGRCASRCQFGALSFDPVLKKAYIDMWKCYGCGVCRGVCDRNAIRLKERSKIPRLRDEWFESVKVPDSGKWV